MNRETFMDRLAMAIRPRSAQAGATVLRKILPFLSDLPDDLFTEAALQALAAKLPRTPSTIQIRAALHAVAQVAPIVPLEDAEDRIWAQSWLQHRQARDLTDRQLEYHLELTRKHKPRAFRYLITTDLLAADVAVRRSWRTDETPQAHIEEEIAHVAASARSAIAAMRSPFTARADDLNDDNTQALQLDALQPPVSARLGPRHLTPEQLDQINPLPEGRKRA